MTKIGTRPRWKRILFLECIAFTHKRHIAIEGYAVLVLGILLSPLWIPYVGGVCLVSVILRALYWPGEFRTKRRAAPYGGIDIAEENTARRGWGWFRRARRTSLSQSTGPRDMEERGEREPLLLKLPVEIRLEIFSHLVCPEKALTICSMKEQRRLVALPTRECDTTRAPSGEFEREKRKNMKDFLGGDTTNPGPALLNSLCKGKLALAKVNRQFYGETIPMLYGEHVFDFYEDKVTNLPGSTAHFLAFTNSIPVERLQDLQHIRMKVSFDFDFNRKKRTFQLSRKQEEEWKRVCEMLKRMHHLLTLRILVRTKCPRCLIDGVAQSPVEGQTPEEWALRDFLGVRVKGEPVVEMPSVRDVVGQNKYGAEFELRSREGAFDVVGVKSGRGA